MTHRIVGVFTVFMLSILATPTAVAQNPKFECAQSTSQYQAEGYIPPQPIGNVNMVVIYAVFHTPPPPPYISYHDSLLYWYGAIGSKMQSYFQTASNGLHNITVTVLTNGSRPFVAADDFQSGATVYENISPLFMTSIMDSVDAHYDLSQFDANHDGYVDFVSLHVLWPLGRGGIGLNFPSGEWVSHDSSNIPGFGNIRVTGQGNAALQQIVYVQQDNDGIPMHEYGHSMAGLPDMDHAGVNDYNHYSLGGFDAMAGGGFNGVVSVYNPWFRDEWLHWITPVQVTQSVTSQSMTDLITTR